MTVHIENMHIDQVIITTPAAPNIGWHVGPMVRHKGVQPMPIEVTITNEEQFRLSINPTTPGGNPAEMDGPAQWTVEGTCTTEPIDEKSAWVKRGPTLGDSTVTVVFDADMGEGVVHIMDTCLVHVQGAMAASAGLAADPPVLIEEPTP